MKKYDAPEVEIEMFNVTDVIVASGGEGCPIEIPPDVCPVYAG